MAAAKHPHAFRSIVIGAGAATFPLQVDGPTPVLILVGRDDPYGLATDAQLLDQTLPHSKLQVLDCGHNAWEEEPARYAGAIIEWVNGGYLNA